MYQRYQDWSPMMALIKRVHDDDMTWKCFLHWWLCYRIQTLQQLELETLLWARLTQWYAGVVRSRSYYDTTQGPISQMFMTSWFKSCENPKILFALIMILMIQSGNKFANAMTAELSWHMQNCDLVWSLFSVPEQRKFLRDLDYELKNHWCNRSQDTWYPILHYQWQRVQHGPDF